MKMENNNINAENDNFGQMETNLFAPYKALGLICSSGFASNYLKK